MRTRLLCLLLGLTLVSGCSSSQRFLASSYGSVKEFLFPMVEADPSPVDQWHLRRHESRVQTNTAIRERMRRD